MPSTTSQSLLQRAQEMDPDAWRKVTSIYAPVVYRWCRHAGLQQTDAADVAQEVFRLVADQIAQFERRSNAGFRGWLKAITNNKIREFFRAQKRQPQGAGGTVAQTQLVAYSLPDDDPATLQTEKALLAQRALELIKADFAPETWQAFLRFTVDGVKAADVAEEFGTTAKAVRQAKCRILKRLRDELDGLD